MRTSILLPFLIIQLSLYSQNSHHGDKIEILDRLENAIHLSDPVYYKSQMRFRAIGTDSFEERNFIISYKTNNNNPLYGYDFQITEALNITDTVTFLILDSSFTFIYNKAEIVSEQNLPKTVNLGSNLEYLRFSLILKEICSPFTGANIDDIKLIDSSNQMTLVLDDFDQFSQYLVVDKMTSMPIKHTTIFKDSDFGLTQSTEVFFYFEANNGDPPESVFNPDYFLSKGYTHKFASPGLDTTAIESEVLSKEHKHLLMSYPFSLANGDTIRIKDYSSEYILLDFWFASCLPCLKALPELESISESYSQLDLQVLAVNCIDKAARLNLDDIIRKKGVHIPLLFGDRLIVQTIGITSFPSYFLITPDGNIELLGGGIHAIRDIIENRLSSK